MIGTHTPSLSDVLPKDGECESPFTDLVHQLSKCSAKDLKVAHLNICSLRNKIDELRCLQLLCKFEVLAITETHLDETVLDTALNIDGMKLLRLDCKGRKGGGCVLYFAEHLHAIHRKDLFIEGLEVIWLQVKTSSTLAISERFRQFCFFTKRSTLLLEKSRKINYLHLFFIEQHAKLLPFLLMLVDQVKSYKKVPF